MLRTSVSDSLDQLKQSLSMRWQVPLLGLSMGLLALAFSYVLPAEPLLPFQQHLDQIAALQRGGFLAEADRMIQGLLQEERLAKAQRALLFRARAETIFLAERTRRYHNPENAKRIIHNHRQALAVGLPATPEVHEQMGKAFGWLDAPEQAVGQLRKAIAAGSKRAGRLRRDLIELLRRTGRETANLVSEDLSAMLAQEDLDPNDLLWAVQEKFNLLSQLDRLDDMGEILEEAEPRLNRAGFGPHVEYLRARLGYAAGQYDQAERILLSLRNALERHDPLAGKATWLLGRVHFRDGRPQEALACYREVIQTQPSGEYYLAGRLGIAECLAALQHIDESAGVYEEVAGAAARYVDGRVVDRDAVRTSLTSLYAMLRTEGRLEAAVRFLRLAAALVPAGDEEMGARYLQDLADLYVSLGEARSAQAGAVSRPARDPTADDAALAGARRAFQDAAETYLRLSQVTLTDTDRSSEMAWLAAVQYDRANMPDRMIAVLEDFLLAHPQSTKVPDALYRLGRAFQSLGRYREAIARYAENQRRFPRTSKAMQSLVPMSQCYMSLGPPSYPEAERALLRIVEQPTEKGRYDPQALEYREALFVLADLYDRWGKPGEAISRLEEILERYPGDDRISRAQFILGDSYRKSGLALLAGKGGSGTEAGGESSPSGPARLRRAEALFTEVVHALQGRPFEALSPVEQLHLKYSYLYRADCAFDLKQYDRAVWLYEEATRRFRGDPISLSAYVQILNCYQRLGKDRQARAIVQRVKWLMKGIAPERSEEMPGDRGLAYWRGFFEWIEESGLFESGSR